MPEPEAPRRRMRSLGVSARPSTGTNVFGALPSPARRMPIKQPEPSSRSCATAAPGIPPHTMTTSGSRNKESTSALTCPWSNGAWENKVCDGAYSVRRRVSALCFCTVLARSQSAGGRLMRARSPRRRRRWYSAKSASIMIDTDVHLDEYANPAGRKPVGMGRQARVNTASATTW